MVVIQRIGEPLLNSLGGQARTAGNVAHVVGIRGVGLQLGEAQPPDRLAHVKWTTGKAELDDFLIAVRHEPSVGVIVTDVDVIALRSRLGLGGEPVDVAEVGVEPCVVVVILASQRSHHADATVCAREAEESTSRSSGPRRALSPDRRPAADTDQTNPYPIPANSTCRQR